MDDFDCQQQSDEFLYEVEDTCPDDTEDFYPFDEIEDTPSVDMDLWIGNYDRER